MKLADRLSEDELAQLVRRAIALSDAPPAVRRAAIKLWPAAQPASWRATAQTVIRHVTAALSFDSWAAAPMALSVRGMSSDTRHLLFSAMGRDVDVRISPAADHYALAGQVLGPDESGLVELVDHAADMSGGTPGAHVATLDALGEFRLDGVRPGSYVLTLRLGGNVIVLPPIDVGER
jgi:hypothetical protein